MPPHHPHHAPRDVTEANSDVRGPWACFLNVFIAPVWDSSWNPWEQWDMHQNVTAGGHGGSSTWRAAVAVDVGENVWRLSARRLLSLLSLILFPGSVLQLRIAGRGLPLLCRVPHHVRVLSASLHLLTDLCSCYEGTQHKPSASQRQERKTWPVLTKCCHPPCPSWEPSTPEHCLTSGRSPHQELSLITQPTLSNSFFPWK